MRRECHVIKLLFLGLSLAIITGCTAGPTSNGNQSSVNANASPPNAPAGKPSAQSKGGTTGAIEVNSNPAGAKVLLVPTDETGASEPQPKGVTPTTIADLQPGTYTVHLELPGHKFAQKSVEVKAGETVQVTAALKKKR